MKKKSSFRFSVLLIAAGLILMAVSFSALIFHSSASDTESKTREITVEEPFTGISIEAPDYHVRFIESSDGQCTVSFFENEYSTCTVQVSGGVLTVEEQSKIPVMIRWFMDLRNNMSIVVSLPAGAHQSLYVESSSGNTEISPSFSFEKARVESSSGNIRFLADANEVELSSFSGSIELYGSAYETVYVSATSGNVLVSGFQANQISLSATSGDIQISNLECGSVDAAAKSGDIRASSVKGVSLDLSTTSGKIDVKNASCGSLNINSTSGDVLLENALLENDLMAETTSGSVRLNRCDAKNLTFITASGDINGSLLTPKQFRAYSSAGLVRVPDSIADGVCKAESSSGDIHFTLAQ